MDQFFLSRSNYIILRRVIPFNFWNVGKFSADKIKEIKAENAVAAVAAVNEYLILHRNNFDVEVKIRYEPKLDVSDGLANDDIIYFNKKIYDNFNIKWYSTTKHEINEIFFNRPLL